MTATLDYRAHPAADLFPLLEGDDFTELVEDIRTKGLLEPISRTPDGCILDGRNRYRACMAAGVEPTYQLHDGDPWAFAISRNLHRRHLTGPQRAMIAARIAERANGSNQFVGKVAAQEGSSIETPPLKHPNQAQAAALLNTSATSVHRARVVIREGIEELGQVVEEGKVTVSAAHRVARQDADQQAEFVEAVRSGAKPSAVAAPSRKPRRESTTDVKPAPTGLAALFSGGDPRVDYVRAFGIRQLAAVELGDLYPAFLAWGKTTSVGYPTTLRRLDDLVHRFRCHRATLAAVAALDAEIAGVKKLTPDGDQRAFAAVLPDHKEDQP